MAVISFLSFAIPRLRDDSALTEIIALLLGVAVAGILLWRSRHFASTSRVALWIEERVPELHYSLVTAMEQLLETSKNIASAWANLHVSCDDHRDRFARVRGPREAHELFQYGANRTTALDGVIFVLRDEDAFRRYQTLLTT